MLLHPHQQKIAHSKSRFKIQRGGRRGGKTVIKVESMLYNAISNKTKLARAFKNRSVIFIAPTQTQARKIVWSSLKERLVGEDGLPIGKYNEARLEVEIPTEDGGVATLFVGGWENRENYRGMSNVIHLEFDEVDTMKNFFIGWNEIFRPMVMETGGGAGFGGTPKKENPNLRRLEKLAEEDEDWEAFHFTSLDNPAIPKEEIEKAKKEMDGETYRQEILAEYVENVGALFKYDALVDLFSNSISKVNEKYLTVDVADDGTDKTVFMFWHGLEAYRIEQFERLNTEAIVSQIREYTAEEQIPMSQVAVDAIGVGAGVASNSLLDGIIGYKSSYQAIKTDQSPVQLPNIHYRENPSLTTEYKNLRSQCVFALADLVNTHKLAVSIDNGIIKEHIIEELALYQDASKGDGKRMATLKDDIKNILGRSPDITDTLIMRMYFEIRERLVPAQSQRAVELANQLNNQFVTNESRASLNSTK